MDNFERLDYIKVYRVTAPRPTFTRYGRLSKPIPGPSLTGRLAVSIGPSDADGDLPLVFDDGRYERVAWTDVEEYDGPGARFRAGLMRRTLTYYTDEFDAIEGYRAVIARHRWLYQNATKRCSSCRQEKRLDEFHTDSREPDGLYRVCKECRAQARRENLS